MDNNYSNIIAPSDGVRRFLCKTSVLFASLFSAAFCVFAFRMNMLEANTLGGSLRSSMLYAAYVMLPLGMLTSVIFARIKSMGLAFSMISLLIAMISSFMLLLNSLASLLREGRLLGISGSLFELLTFGALFALLVNLVMSCMDFKLQPVIGSIGAVASGIAMVITSIRTTMSYSALSFAWNSEFDWKNLGKIVDTDKLRYHAEWIFRSIPRDSAGALHTMFGMRLFERVSACVFYCFMIMIFLKFQKEMKAFNKLLQHASEYVEIPTARIYQGIFGSGARNDGEPVVQTQKKKTGESLKSRLRALSNIAKAKEQGMDITEMADEYDSRRADDEENYGYSSYGEHSEYDDDDNLTEEERYIVESRRRMSQSGEDSSGRPGRRRRSDDFGEDERPGRRRRSDDFGEDERPGRPRRSDDFGEDERPGRPRPEQEEELTEQEKYLMEERRRRARRMHSEGSTDRRTPDRRSGRSRYD